MNRKGVTVLVGVMIAQISRVFALLVIAPMMVVYIFTVLEWWRGVST